MLQIYLLPVQADSKNMWGGHEGVKLAGRVLRIFILCHVGQLLEMLWVACHVGHEDAFDENRTNVRARCAVETFQHPALPNQAPPNGSVMVLQNRTIVIGQSEIWTGFNMKQICVTVVVYISKTHLRNKIPIFRNISTSCNTIIAKSTGFIF